MRNLIIVPLLLILSGCATFGSGTPADKPMANERTVSSNSIIWELLFIWPMYHRGSGVQIDDNWIITAKHVEGIFSGWEDNEKCDLALVHSPDPEFKQQDKISPSYVGQNIAARGMPMYRGWYATPGKVTKTGNDDCQMVTTSANVIPGQSGGGVYDDNGNLLGVISHGYYNGTSTYVPLWPEPIRGWIESVIGHKLILTE